MAFTTICSPRGAACWGKVTAFGTLVLGLLASEARWLLPLHLEVYGLVWHDLIHWCGLPSNIRVGEVWSTLPRATRIWAFEDSEGRHVRDREREKTTHHKSVVKPEEEMKPLRKIVDIGKSLNVRPYAYKPWGVSSNLFCWVEQGYRNHGMTKSG